MKSILSLGSNKGDRMENLLAAMRHISEKIGPISASSSIYETEPWGFDAPIPFYNQVISVNTKLSAEYLLNKCLEIESQLGRIRAGGNYESRTLDIDILFYGDDTIDLPELQVPHPAIAKRKFVLLPLVEIDPDFVHPILGKKVCELLDLCKDESWIKKVPLSNGEKDSEKI